MDEDKGGNVVVSTMTGREIRFFSDADNLPSVVAKIKNDGGVYDGDDEFFPWHTILRIWLDAAP